MHDVMQQSVFYVFAALAVLSGFMTITQNNPVRCVLSLVLTFFAMAVLWLMIEAEFLALILVLVYVGAVMTLFLFVVMMLDVDVESIKSHMMRYMPIGLVLVSFLAALLLTVLPKAFYVDSVQKPLVSTQSIAALATESTVSINKEVLSNTEALGLVLYTDYVLAFEIAAVILLVAIISAITLIHRQVKRGKRQDVVSQIMTRRQDRIKLLSMQAEKE